MALFKSQVITQASGSVGGMTYTRTASGMVMRARSKPVNPNTELQQVVRTGIKDLASQWSADLTAVNRDRWETYAKNVLVKNKLGDSIKLSGIAMFIKMNAARIQAGLPVVANGPIQFVSTYPVDFFPLQAELTPFGISVRVAGSPTAPPTRALVYVARPQQATINFFKGPFRYSGEILKAAGTVNYDVPYDPSWSVGQAVFIRVVMAAENGVTWTAGIKKVVLLETPVAPPDPGP